MRYLMILSDVETEQLKPGDDGVLHGCGDLAMSVSVRSATHLYSLLLQPAAASASRLSAHLFAPACGV